MKSLNSTKRWTRSMLQTKVKPLECAVYLQKSKNMARKDLLLACTMVLQIWETEEMPQDWKDAIILLEFIKKCLKDCGNYQGISLLSMARKILVRIFLITANDLVSSSYKGSVFSTICSCIPFLSCFKWSYGKGRDQTKRDHWYPFGGWA